MKNKKGKVLIVDDDVDILQLLKKRVEASDFDCLTAEDPVVGLRTVVKEKPDLILLDLMLPKMSGLGLLRIVKNNPEIAHIPVVVLTALGDKMVEMEAVDLGAAACLNKDCEPHEIMDAIHRYVL